MKFNKILSIALALPALAALFSCADKADYTPAVPVSGAQVYFHESVKTDWTVTPVESTFSFDLTRVATDSEANVELKVVADEASMPVFNIPSAAVFQAGSETATVECSVNTDAMEYDKPYTVTVSIANEEDATIYAQSSVTFTVTLPAPWISLGVGKFAENFLGEAGKYYDVEILQNELQPNTFRLVEPYAEILGDIAVDKYLEFTIWPKGSDFNGITLDAEYVVFNDYNMGEWNSNYAEDIYALHPYRFGRTPDKWTYNVVLDYQDNKLPGEVSLAPIYYLMIEGGGWDKSEANTISILFPGYVKADYTASVDYTGIFTAKDATVYASAQLTLGADVTDAQAIVMPLDADAAAVADAIAAGELETTKVEAGRIEVPFNAEELGGNNFQIVVAVLVDGAVKTVASTSFEYYGGGKNPWQSLGTGYYTDDILSSMWGLPTVTYEVEILEHTENAGMYRLVNPYNNQVYPAEYVEVFASQLGNSLAPAGYNLEVNAMDPEGVYIPAQSLGMDFGDGEWAFETEGSRYLANYELEFLKGYGYMGAIVDGVIKFPAFKRTNGIYQGILYEGSSAYYAATTGELEIVLPGSNAFARNMATAKANTAKRNALKKSSGVKADMKLKKIFNLQAEKFNAPNF